AERPSIQLRLPMNTLLSRLRRRGAGLFVLPVVAACLAATASAQVVFSTDFGGALPPEFAAPNAHLWPTEGYFNLGPTSRQFGSTFLRYFDPALAPTTLHLTNLPPHTCVDVAFLLAIIDSWDGVELFQVRVDGQLLFSHWFDCSSNTSSYAPPP